ncbi:MAG: hypothetical protein EOS56_05625 [Mesorhizobium sp.]|nr:MAG: hypothetical protein EOS55_13765 [Mesorhizobium sp.]RWC63357.1 MAG: hypothetical protein EOS56_05625 [Mesorhizobium sp.]RWC67000.1 MAG: hypothetical protein EOS29_02440 [Mesorhizobium sp.]
MTTETANAAAFQRSTTRCAIVPVCEVASAQGFFDADGTHNRPAFDPIRITCRICERGRCPQRAAPLLNRMLTVDYQRRGADASRQLRPGAEPPQRNCETSPDVQTSSGAHAIRPGVRPGKLEELPRSQQSWTRHSLRD